MESTKRYLSPSTTKYLDDFIKVTGKEINEVVFVPSVENGTFSAYYSAEKIAKERGYKIGSMCLAEPIALAKDVPYIAKWRNIERSDWHLIEGLMLSDYFREKNVTLVFFK